VTEEGAAPNKRRHAVLGFLMVLSIITYLDRTCLSVASNSIKTGLTLTSAQWGWVTGLFTLFYGLWAVPLGGLGDRLGQRKVLAYIVVGWSAFTGLTGAAVNYLMLLVTACLFGSGEAGAYPNIAGCLSRWYPAGERARAQGFVWGASRIGGAIAPWFVVPIISIWGWREPFLLFAGFGFIWAAAWYVWYRNHSSQNVLVGAETGAAPVNKAVPWGRLFRSRQLWVIMAMYWCYVWGSVFFISWMHEYMTRGRSFSDRQMQVYSTLPFIMGMLGNVMGGFVGDRMVKKLGISLGRRIMGSFCLIATALIFVGLAQTNGKISAVVLLSLGFGVMDCMLPSAWALCQDVGREYSGAVSGAMNTAGSAGGFTCSVVAGYLLERPGSYSHVLLLIATMLTISAVLFWQLDPSKPLLEDGAHPSAGGKSRCA
jgi:MFS family permease